MAERTADSPMGEPRERFTPLRETKEQWMARHTSKEYLESQKDKERAPSPTALIARTEARDTVMNAIESLPKYPPPMLVSSLEFSSMEWGAAEMYCIANLLPSFARLSRFDLSKNKIGDQGAAELAKVLPGMLSLTSLDISFNKIGDEGAKALSESLQLEKCNRSFMALRLTGNEIGDEGVTAMFESLKANLSLEAVYLGGNKIGGDGANAISAALKGNRTLTKIDVRDNALDAAAKEAVMTAVGNRNAVEGPELRVEL